MKSHICRITILPNNSSACNQHSVKLEI
uniref:Uncharacterized protein n=1 Tax=Rhizophora mucronata TaxID=61149 RepID=A0A2P2N4Z3_RHIMU